MTYDNLIVKFEELIDTFGDLDAIVISDYGGGCISVRKGNEQIFELSDESTSTLITRLLDEGFAPNEGTLFSLNASMKEKTPLSIQFSGHTTFAGRDAIVGNTNSNINSSRNIKVSVTIFISIALLCGFFLLWKSDLLSHLW